MSVTWITIAGLTAGTVAIKAFGPVTAGGRDLPPRVLAVVALVAPALLAALVVVLTLGADRPGVTVDARVAGLLAAAGCLTARLPLLVVMIAAALATAVVRAVA